jgi:uncharacterized protein (DUF58 family)
VFVLALLSVPAVFINGVYGYLPALFAVFALLLSLGYLAALKRSLVFAEISDFSNCRRETEVGFTVELRNRSPLIFPRLEPVFYISDIFGGDDTLTSQRITLSPREKRGFDFTVRFDHIGSYSAGIKKIVIHDLLGLFSCELKNAKRYRVDVSPKIFDVSNLDIAHTVLTESEKHRAPTTIDGADYIGVREYVWGDPIKTIHWKLSARGETYLTKQFESYGIVGVSVLFDFFSPKYDAETMMSVFDAVVESGLSIGYFAEENGMEHEIVYKDFRGETKRVSRGRGEDLSDIIADMPRISHTDGARLGVGLLSEEAGSRYSHGNIVYCTANPTEEIADMLCELKLKRKRPLLIAVIPEKIADDKKDELMRPLKTLEYEGIPYYVLASARELGGGERAS